MSVCLCVCVCVCVCVVSEAAGLISISAAVGNVLFVVLAGEKMVSTWCVYVCEYV